MPNQITCLDLAQHTKLLFVWKKKGSLLISRLKQMNISHGFNRDKISNSYTAEKAFGLRRVVVVLVVLVGLMEVV